MAEVKDFRPRVRLNVPAVPDLVIDVVAHEALNAFLHMTQIWQTELAAPLTYAVGATSYDPTPQLPVGSQPFQIKKVRWRPTGQEILFLTKDQLSESFGGWESERGVRPDYYTFNNPTNARMYPAAVASIALAIEMTVAIGIAPGFTTFPTWILNEWGDIIASGIYARLYAMPNREWTNLPLATARGQEFMQGAQAAKAKALAGFGRPTYEVAYGGIP